MPKRQREIPHHTELRDYDHAVAGHAGTMCDESGELFFKPVHQQEVDFYQAAFSSHPQLAAVMPPFFGTLSKGEPLGSDSSSTPSTQSDNESKPHEETKTQVEWVPSKNRKLETHQYLVLENASTGYTHANILDAKLGFRLYDEKAPQGKKERFDKIAQETTHKNFSFRIAGMRVYHANASPPLAREGVKPAFKVEDDYKVYDKDFGRNYVNDDNLKQSLRSYVFNDAAGIDEELGKQVCAGFVRDLEKIRDAIENEQSEMFSASCLFLFEGDGPTLRKSLAAQKAREDKLERQRQKLLTVAPNPDDYLAATRQDSGICLTEADVPVNTEDVELEEENEEEEEEGGEEDRQRAFGVTLIDFAHARFTGGKCDENSLRGVRNLITLFKDMAV